MSAIIIYNTVCDRVRIISFLIVIFLEKTFRFLIIAWAAQLLVLILEENNYKN